VCRHLAEQRGLGGRVEIDSAGTGDWHVGDPPDPRAQHEAKRRGIDISKLRGRQVHVRDFEHFDYVLAMDSDNLAGLLRLCPTQYKNKVRRFLDYTPACGLHDVPDPYYGGEAGFRKVYDLIENACNKLLDDIEAK
jgi:protein-tyrosine phosphatase